MNGIIFSEFIAMVEETFSPEIAGQIVEQANLPWEHADTSVGSYDHREILSLVEKLSAATSLPVEALVKTICSHMLSRLNCITSYSMAPTTPLTSWASSRSMCTRNYESFTPYGPTQLRYRLNDATRVMVCRWPRSFGRLVRGLIEGCIQHYGENMSVAMEDFSTKSSSHVRFTLRSQ